KIFLFASLRSGARTFGYTVMPYDEEFFSRHRHRTFVESMSLALTNINRRLRIESLTQADTKTD
ncbi:MAG: hypothetical protein IKE35_05730, partial [Lachnospiraceae bacterium]|nr:hypothetical protein [Lachnospiraceae bacterium]